jgi:arylsulfatase A-like enzyme
MHNKLVKFKTCTQLWSSLCLLLSIFVTQAQENPAQQRPNIVLFLVDDMGWQDTSVPFHSVQTDLNKRYHTPNMERMAAEGVKFTRAYSCSVCSPTRVSLMTGMNAMNHRVTNWTIKKNVAQDAKHPTLSFPKWNVNGMSATAGIENTVHATPFPSLLQQSGYHTVHVGKAHFGALTTPGENPLNLGFDVNIAGTACGGLASYWGTHDFSHSGKLGKKSTQRGAWDVPGLEPYHGKDIFLTEALTLEALKAIEKPIKQNKPFYLYMAHYAIHAPIMEDKRFYQKYLEKGIDPTEAKYASMIEAMDKSLGDIMDFLQQRNVADNTIILFMSDNGGLSATKRGGEKHSHNRPLSSGKGSAHEGGVRVPMMVKWPRVSVAGSVCHQPLIIEDFFPSILEMAGVKQSQTVQNIDGQSFVSLIKTPATGIQSRALYWHYPNQWGPKGPGIGASSAILLDDWKLIYYHQNQSVELFNLKTDIGEQNNLASKNRAKITKLSRLLGDTLKQSNAQMPSLKDGGARIPYPSTN